METRGEVFHEWLRDRLASRGSSGAALARDLKLPSATVYRWLHGLALPDSGELPGLAEALGLRIADVRIARARHGARISRKRVPLYEDSTFIQDYKSRKS